MATEITDDDLATAALEPAEMAGDQGSVKQRSVDELLKVRDRLDNATAAARNHGGISFTRLTPGGTV